MRYPVLLAVLILTLVTSVATAQSFEADVTPLVDATCLRCHGDRTVTPVNLARLGFDLTDHETFRAWEKVYQRLSKGEMPPAAAPQPEAALVETALGSLKRALVDANLAARGAQRTPLRRLTRLEYAYTIQDLLGIDEAIASELTRTLPAEADSGGFDTVAANQGISPLHVWSYLDAADRALEAAIALGPRPPMDRYEIDYAKSQKLSRNSKSKSLGGRYGQEAGRRLCDVLLGRLYVSAPQQNRGLRGALSGPVSRHRHRLSRTRPTRRWR